MDVTAQNPQMCVFRSNAAVNFGVIGSCREIRHLFLCFVSLIAKQVDCFGVFAYFCQKVLFFNSQTLTGLSAQHNCVFAKK